MPPSRPQGVCFRIPQIHLNIKALPCFNHLYREDFRTRRYDTLGEAEADGEIDKIGWLAIITAWVLPP